MKLSRILHPSAALLLGVFALSEPALAQRYLVEVDKPDFEDLQSPQVGG